MLLKSFYAFFYFSIVPTAPQDVMYRNLTSTSIELTWNPPMTFNGPNEGYRVTYRLISASIAANTIVVDDTSTNITNLEIYTEYSVEVVALSDKGPSEVVSIIVITDEDCK